MRLIFKFLFIFLFFLFACNTEEQSKTENKQTPDKITEIPQDPTSSATTDTEENQADTLNASSKDSTGESVKPTDLNANTKQETVHEVKDEKGEKKGTVKKIYYDEEAKKILESPIEIYNPIDDPDPTPDPSPSEFVEVDQDPVLLNWEQLKRNIKKPKGVNASGTVYIKVLISKKGFYRGHVIRKSPHPRLSVAVVEQVKKIRAKPAKKDGKPVKVWVNLKYEFK